MKKALPKGLIANTLNTRNRRMGRGHIDDDTVPRMHVSSLIKSSTQDAFCPREFVLRYMERTSLAGAGVPPKFELLYAVGHYYGDYIVQKFLERNPDWAQYAYGDWRCICGQTTFKACNKPQGAVCDHCTHPVEIYVEIDLFNPLKTVVGHADLIFNVDGFFYVYEFKSIDRADIIFSEITEPLGDHLLQASNYYYMLKNEGKRVSRVIRFVYVDRSMSELYRALPFKEVEAEAVAARRLTPLYNKAKRVHRAIEEGRLPDRICDTITCSRAKQCGRAVSCFNRSKKTIKRTPIVETKNADTKKNETANSTRRAKKVSRKRTVKRN